MNVFSIKIFKVLSLCLIFCALVPVFWIITEVYMVGCLNFCFTAYQYDDGYVLRQYDSWLDRKPKNSRRLVNVLEPTKKPSDTDRSHSVEKWTQVLLARRSQMFSACKEYSAMKNFSQLDLKMKMFSYDGNSNSIYCDVPKVGSSYWKRIFYVMANRLDVSPLTIRGIDIHAMLSKFKMDKMPASETLGHLKRATKFMFARDPYHRLFSAYCDKLFVYSFETPNISEAILDRLRNGKKENGKKSNLDRDEDSQTVHNKMTIKLKKFNLTFAEAMLYSSGGGAFEGLEIDRHFVSVSDTCNPCFVQYDIIGKIETFKEDTSFILKYLNNTKLLKFLHNGPSSNVQGILKDVVKRTFYIVRSYHFSAEEKDIAFRRLWKAFHFRGLINDRITYPFTVSESGKVTSSQMVDVVLQSHQAWDDKSERHRQQEKYYHQAYRSVPLSVLDQFRESIEIDCKIFGYECKPSDLFEGRAEGDEENNIFSDDRFLYQ